MISELSKTQAQRRNCLVYDCIRAKEPVDGRGVPLGYLCTMLPMSERSIRKALDALIGLGKVKRQRPAPRTSYRWEYLTTGPR